MTAFTSIVSVVLTQAIGALYMTGCIPGIFATGCLTFIGFAIKRTQ